MEHVAPGPHCVPHAPQLAGSVSIETQVPAHAVWPAAQAQLPALQVCPLGQALSQRPQLATLVCVSTQLAPHAVRPLSHVALQAPAEHKSPAPQALPQPPQFAPLDAGSMHSVPQASSAGKHWHALPLQAWPDVHVTPHAPQLAVLFCVVTHTPAQELCPTAQPLGDDAESRLGALQLPANSTKHAPASHCVSVVFPIMFRLRTRS